jgi:orotate phosphoribosyltransferase
MTSALDVDALLSATGAVLNGHFRLTSGRHSGTYIEKFRIMEDPHATTALCGLIADHFRASDVEVVAGPAVGGIILAYETARQLGIRNVFAEKAPDGSLSFERGFAVGAGERVLVVDDVLTTGGSVKKLLAQLQGVCADVAGIAFLIDRTGGKVDFGVPFYTCRSLELESYDPETCPLCKKGLPLVET